MYVQVSLGLYSKGVKYTDLSIKEKELRSLSVLYTLLYFLQQPPHITEVLFLVCVVFIDYQAAFDNVTVVPFH